MKTILIYYHAPCRDGFASAWVANKFFNETYDKLDISLKFYGVDPSRIKETFLDNIETFLKTSFNDEIDVYCLDVALGANEYQILSNNTRIKNFVIIDHHLSGYQSMLTVYTEDNLPHEYIYDVKESGCSLTWKHFYPDLTIPRTLEYIKDRDIWAWAMPKSKEISEGMFAMMPNNRFNLWDDWMANEDQNLAKTEEFGSILLDQTNRYLPKKQKDGKIVEYQGYKVFVINSTNLNSELGNYVSNLKNDNGSYYCDFAFIWRYSYEASVYYVSLRSSDQRDIDVSLIAKKLTPEGGGHKCASGCTLTELPKEFLP